MPTTSGSATNLDGFRAVDESWLTVIFWDLQGQPLESKSEAGWKGRRLNAVSVPWMVKVPSSEEEAEK